MGGQVERAFGEAMTHDRAFFEREGLVHDIRGERGKTRGMVNFTKLAMLNTGAVRQVGTRQQQLEDVMREILELNPDIEGGEKAAALLEAA